MRLAAVLFRIVQALLVPAAVIAYPPFVIKILAFSRRSGTSATLFASFYTRYMQHKLGVRRDEPCERLMMAVPSISHLGLRLETAPTLVAHRLTGYVPRIYRYPYPGEPPFRHQSAARTTFYDAALERRLAAIDQLVILGAGFDTRAYRLPAGTRVRCFEVDAPRTQAFKREMLEKAGLDTARVVYAPVDFLKEDWLDKLIQEGFRPDQPSLFLWEAVTMYLTREAVENTLRKIAGLAPGTAVALDYVSTGMIESRSLFMRYARLALKVTGEPWRFGTDNIGALLASCGLSMEEQRSFGPEGAFVIATV